MNPWLSRGETDALLWVLERALIHIRSACWSKDIGEGGGARRRLSLLPRLLIGPPETWTIEGFELFFDGLVGKYPEFARNYPNTTADMVFAMDGLAQAIGLRRKHASRRTR